MFNRFFELLYLKVFVNIVIGHSKTTIYIEMLDRKNSVVKSDQESFDVIYLDEEMYEYISDAIKETPYYYISVLDNSLSQGAIPTCEKNKIENYHDMISSEYKCYNNKWIYYTEKSDLYGIEKTFEKVGVDFIFSPFVVLRNFFKDKIDTHLAMFILIEDSVLALSVFSKSELLYAEHLEISHEFSSEELLIDDDVSIDVDDDDLSLDDEDSIDLDSIDALDDIDELDDFGDIADLDSIDDIEEFSEGKDLEEELFEEAEEEKERESVKDSFNEDYQRFSLIQTSINNFYQDERFKSEFIESVYIADSVRVSPDLKKYLEEEMFLNVYIRHIDLGAEICELAKMELL
jgi:hypothetical protein